MGKCTKLLIGLALAAALTSTANTALADNIIRFVLIGDGSLRVGEEIRIPILFGFDELTVGGGFDVFFLPEVFSFHTFEFDPSLGDDPAFRLKPPDDESDVPFTIAFARLNGFVGKYTVGTLTLIGKQNGQLTSDPTAGGELVLWAVDNDFRMGPFVDPDGDPMFVDYMGLYLVPEPGALLLVGTGLLGIATMRRQRA